MRSFLSFFIIVTLVISSCNQQQKKIVAITAEQNKSFVAQKIKIPVDGMTCSACQSKVKKTIKSLDGVKDAEVSLGLKVAFITYYPDLIKPEQIQKAVNDKGYAAGKPQEVKQWI